MYFIASECTTWSDVIRNDLAADEYNELADEIGTSDKVAISAEVESSIKGVEEFIVSLAKEQIRNIKASASASSY
ncbi:MAG: hypothetical protein J6V06_00080 [Clostridia bacterium]|nr:hypothetical protein [Clostridia bacterium]